MRFLCVLMMVLAATPVAAQDRPTVATVNYPLAYFAERLGGDIIDVVFPIPADVDPAFWRPGLSDITAMQAADLIALNGADYAQWTTKVSLPRSRIVDTSASLSENYIATETVTHSHGDGGEHSHTGTATHTWLDFEMAAGQAAALATAMARRIPATADGMDERLSDLTSDLMDLDVLGATMGSGLEGRKIIATHPRYQYFSRAYGLNINAMDWAAGDTPSDAQWTDLESRIETEGADIILWEASPPEDALRRAEALGLVNVIFPPLANRPAGGDTFTSGMRAVLSALADARS